MRHIGRSFRRLAQVIEYPPKPNSRQRTPCEIREQRVREYTIRESEGRDLWTGRELE